MAKFIKCDCCGKRIPFGAEVYKFHGYAGLYCSGDCFADSYGEVHELDDGLASDCYHKVYDDARRDEIRKEMEEHRKAIKLLLEELEVIGN